MSIPGSNASSRLRQVAYHTARIFLGGIFVYASIDKILKPLAFAQVVYNYQILPEAAVNLAALVLPWLELLIGGCLLAGVWLPGASLLGSGLLAAFIGALGFNLARGLDVYCGCFSTQTAAGSASRWTIARDVFFLAISVYLSAVVLLTPGKTASPKCDAGQSDRQAS